MGFGPTTSRLKVGGSTTELTALDGTPGGAAPTIVSPAAPEPGLWPADLLGQVVDRGRQLRIRGRRELR